MTLSKLKKFIESISSDTVNSVTEEIIKQLSFAEEVGLGYLTLNRTTSTLSGGEAQRIKIR